MKRKISLMSITTAIILFLSFIPLHSASAQFADGTYNVPYEMKEANSDNTSIANGYFQSPAKVTISGDTATVQFTVKSADMVQSISVPGSSINVVGESGDTRTYSFQTSASNLSSPITMGMHIIVPEGTPGLEQGYDRQHNARAVFDVSGISSGGEAPSSNGEKDKDVENPKTGDNSPIVMYTILLIGAGAAFVVVRKLRLSSN